MNRIEKKASRKITIVAAGWYSTTCKKPLCYEYLPFLPYIYLGYEKFHLHNISPMGKFFQFQQRFR
jgi:hypothetical protein